MIEKLKKADIEEKKINIMGTLECLKVMEKIQMEKNGFLHKMQ